MDGVEATKMILKNSELKNTPIVAVSSFAMKSDKDFALSAGIKEYITKPINIKNFINILDKYLG
jgi:CheY-like chemotaxis protein